MNVTTKSCIMNLNSKIFRITKILNPSKSKVYRNLKVGDIFYIEYSFNPRLKSNSQLVKFYVIYNNDKDKECVVLLDDKKTLRQTVNALANFEYEQLII